MRRKTLRFSSWLIFASIDVNRGMSLKGSKNKCTAWSTPLTSRIHSRNPNIEFSSYLELRISWKIWKLDLSSTRLWSWGKNIFCYFLAWLQSSDWWKYSKLKDFSAMSHSCLSVNRQCSAEVWFNHSGDCQQRMIKIKVKIWNIYSV